MTIQDKLQVLITVTLFTLCMTFGVISTVSAAETEDMVPNDAEAEAIKAIAERVVNEPALDEAEETVTEEIELGMTETKEAVTEAAEPAVTEMEEVVTEETEPVLTEPEETDTEATEPPPLVGKQHIDTQIAETTEKISTLTASVDELQKRAKLHGSQGQKALDEYSWTFSNDTLETVAHLRDLKEIYTEFSTNMGDHFDAWAADINTINNKKLRKLSEKRMEKGTETFAMIKKEMGKGNETAAEFGSNLQDVTTYLSFDMTQSGVKEISSVLGSLVKQGKTIQKQLNKVAKLLNELPALSDGKNQ